MSNRGRLHLAFVFVDSSEDFEHVQSPTNEVAEQATPIQTPSGGATNQEEETEGEETALPPDWEERRVSVSSCIILEFAQKGSQFGSSSILNLPLLASIHVQCMGSENPSEL